MTEEVKTQTEVVATPAAADTAKPAEAKATGKAAKVKKRKAVKQVPRGNAYIQATYNNTIISVGDPNGNVIGWSSAGKVGFKGPKKATPYAASQVAKDLMERIADYGVKEVAVFIKGIGGGREGAIRALHANGLIVSSINDVTPIPHNGCRPPKRRRV